MTDVSLFPRAMGFFLKHLLGEIKSEGCEKTGAVKYVIKGLSVDYQTHGIEEAPNNNEIATTQILQLKYLKPHYIPFPIFLIVIGNKLKQKLLNSIT